jgi:hypothetical protein
MYAQLQSAPDRESVYQALTRWAAQAPVHLLRVIALSSTIGGIAVMLIDPTRWPVALGMVALASLGGWGLVEHRRGDHSSPWIDSLESMLAVIGGLTFLIAVMVAIFLLMGPAPHF